MKLQVTLKIDLVESKKNKFFNIFLIDSGIEEKTLDYIDNYLSENLMFSEIVYDYGHINNFEVVEVKDMESSNKNEHGFIIECENPKKVRKRELKKQKQEKFLANIENLEITKKDLVVDVVKDKITVKTDVGNIDLPIMSFFTMLEKTEHDKMILTNSFGENIFEFYKESMLNAGLADIQIFRNEEDMKKDSLFTPKSIGGIFVRDNGILHVGDIERTKFLLVNISNLIKEMIIKNVSIKELDWTRKEIEKK